MDVRKIVLEIVDIVKELPFKNVLEDLHVLTPEEVSELLKIAKSTVYNLTNQGELPAVKIGGAVRFRPRALYVYMLANERINHPGRVPATTAATVAA